MNKRILYGFVIFALLSSMVGIASFVPQLTAKADHPHCNPSDPDGDENGGVDCEDHNNGSGNDEDCEDDNNGQGIPAHCRRDEDPTDESTETPVVTNTPTSTDTPTNVPTNEPTVTSTPSSTPVVTSTPSPEEEQEKVEDKKVFATSASACSTCFVGFVYIADESSDLDWIKKNTADSAKFTIQISAETINEWPDAIIAYAIDKDASVILVWDNVLDEQWISVQVDTLRTAGVTCINFAFTANEDPNWIPDAKQISADLMK